MTELQCDGQIERQAQRKHDESQHTIGDAVIVVGVALVVVIVVLLLSVALGRFAVIVARVGSARVPTSHNATEIKKTEVSIFSINGEMHHTQRRYALLCLFLLFLPF